MAQFYFIFRELFRVFFGCFLHYIFALSIRRWGGGIKDKFRQCDSWEGYDSAVLEYISAQQKWNINSLLWNDGAQMCILYKGAIVVWRMWCPWYVPIRNIFIEMLGMLYCPWDYVWNKRLWSFGFLPARLKTMSTIPLTKWLYFRLGNLGWWDGGTFIPCKQDA